MSLWIIACVTAYFVKGLCGFANTLVFTSILSFGTANAGISPIDLLVGFPANIILTWRNRKQLDPKVFIPLAALVLAGCIPGALLLKNGDVRGVKLFFGFVVVFLGGEMLLRDRGGQLKSSRAVLAVIGVAAGVLCGLFGVGALLAAYVSHVTTESRSFKANISAVFITEIYSASFCTARCTSSRLRLSACRSCCSRQRLSVCCSACSPHSIAARPARAV